MGVDEEFTSHSPYAEAFPPYVAPAGGRRARAVCDGGWAPLVLRPLAARAGVSGRGLSAEEMC